MHFGAFDLHHVEHAWLTIVTRTLQLAEQLITRRDRNGFPVREWQKMRERNEARAKLAVAEGADLPVDPPGTFDFTLRLRDGAAVLVREHLQRPSLVVDIPLSEMTASEGRVIAQAILRVCRSLEAQEREGVEP